MTNQEILKRAIKKAQRGGYKPDVIEVAIIPYDGSLERYRLYFKFDDDGVVDHYSHDDRYVLFSHDFAKTFWGEEDACKHKGTTSVYCEECDCDTALRVWQFQLQQMVLEEDPIQYLAKFI